MHQKTQKFYLGPHEKGPHRSIQSQRYIIKIIVSTAVGRPAYNMLGECLWDGKVGIFPFVEEVSAQRTSINRVRGTVETKAVTQVTKDRMREKIIHYLVPAIMEKWPTHRSKIIYIQQDNAMPHMPKNDSEWQAACVEYKKRGFDFTLVQQPPNNPDLNCLDLGFFRAIQTLQHKKRPRNIAQLLDVVNTSYGDFDPKTLFNVWHIFQYTMVEILKVRGNNTYDQPHACE